MDNKNKRQFTRVDVQLDVYLDFGIRKYRHVARNLSLNGIYIRGLYDQQAGDACIIRVKPPLAAQDAAICAVGSVARVSGAGMAVKFISMKIDSFMQLQTILSSSAKDPAQVWGESVKGISFTQEDSLIFYDNALPLKKYSFPVAEYQ
ncbi:MAG: PilZ domain-containing protein [Candidatus Electrothrix sp. YB6]